MPTMHPHWQSDDAQEVPVRTSTKTPAASEGAPKAATRAAQASTRPALKAVSRRPAALVGIGIVLLTLFAYFQPDLGSQTTGQAQNSFTILLDPTTSAPSIVAAPGDQIVFLNALQDPQQIDLSEVPTYEGIGRTPEIPFRGKFVTTIARDAGPGEYAFSVVDSDVTGTIYVENYGDDNMVFPDEGMEPEEEVQEEEAAEEEIVEDELDSEASFEDLYPYPGEIFGDDSDLADTSAMQLPGTMQDDDPVTDVIAQDLPQNPFTVQYGSLHGAPLPPPYQGELIHEGAPIMPVSQPATGAGEWVVIGMSAGAVLVMTRKAFRRV